MPAALAISLALGATVVAVSLGAPSGSVKQVAGKKGCYTADGSSNAGAGTCKNIKGGTGATTIALSPDGRFAYVAGYGDPPDPPPVLTALRRDPGDGSLRQIPGKKGCYSSDGSDQGGAGACVNARNVGSGDATSLVISRDGRFLYLANQEDAGGIAIFRRNLRNGKLRQLAGKKGCISETGESEAGPGTCARARAVSELASVHVTPDQRYLYAANYDNEFDGIAVFRRNRRSGRLDQLNGPNGCITKDGTTRESVPEVVCRVFENLADPWDIVMPDNRFVYVNAAYGPDLVQALKRNGQGGLVPLAGTRSCVSNDGTSPEHDCVDGVGLDNVERLVLSKNERFIYVSSYSDPSPVAVIDRNPRTGKLSQRDGLAACISADGSSGGEADVCRDGRALDGGYAGTLSQDGRTLYFTEYTAGGLVVFRVSPRTGAFKQLAGKSGCVTTDGSSDEGAGTCGRARAVEGAYQVTARGDDVYVASYSEDGVALLRAR